MFKHRNTSHKLFYFIFVTNRSFIDSKLEQTIRIIHMQFSVHTIKVKEIQNLYKTKHWGEITHLKIQW